MREGLNPEFVRNLRAQLRPTRMLAVGGMTAALALAVGYSMAHNRPDDWGREFLELVLYAQTLALAAGGGVSCLYSIYREKEMNTFDFQRVTRLTPWELTLGKLFGAPALAYFVVLCLMPAAVVGAAVSGAKLSFFLTAYLVMVVGSIAFHALALLVSLWLERTSAAAAVILILVTLWLLSAPPEELNLNLNRLTPFQSADLVGQTQWRVGAGLEYLDRQHTALRLSDPYTDVLFGQPVHHFPVLLFLYLTFAAWILLAVVRNIKRDPSAYELYSPSQALGFALYLNFVLFGFFRWETTPRNDAQAALLGLNLGIFFILGLALLRNRDRVRRRLRDLGARAAGVLAAAWPAPYLLGGLALVGVVLVVMVSAHSRLDSKWSPWLGLLQVAFVTLWVVRDVSYLQWFNLRRLRRPLPVAVLYLIVFYICAGIVLATLDFLEVGSRTLFSAVLVPGSALDLDVAEWAARKEVWLVALAAQLAIAALFFTLQRKKLSEMLPEGPTPAGAAPAAAGL